MDTTIKIKLEIAVKNNLSGFFHKAGKEVKVDIEDRHHIEQRLCVEALRTLADLYEDRIGSRFPVPNRELTIEFYEVKA